MDEDLETEQRELRYNGILIGPRSVIPEEHAEQLPETPEINVNSKVLEDILLEKSRDL